MRYKNGLKREKHSNHWFNEADRFDFGKLRNWTQTWNMKFLFAVFANFETGKAHKAHQCQTHRCICDMYVCMSVSVLCMQQMSSNVFVDNCIAFRLIRLLCWLLDVHWVCVCICICSGQACTVDKTRTTPTNCLSALYTVWAKEKPKMREKRVEQKQEQRNEKHSIRTSAIDYFKRILSIDVRSMAKIETSIHLLKLFDHPANRIQSVKLWNYLELLYFSYSSQENKSIRRVKILRNMFRFSTWQTIYTLWIELWSVSESDFTNVIQLICDSILFLLNYNSFHFAFCIRSCRCLWISMINYSAYTESIEKNVKSKKTAKLLIWFFFLFRQSISLRHSSRFFFPGRDFSFIVRLNK